MKKYFIWLLLAACIPALAGCSKEKTQESEKVQSEEDEQNTTSGSEMTGTTIASVEGPYGQISVRIPDDWTAQAVPVDGAVPGDAGMLTYGLGLYGLLLKPEAARTGYIELYCSDNFGVCGTGLHEEKVTLGGYTANIGTFDENKHWDFVAFENGDENDRVRIIAQPVNCISWTDDMWDMALSILDTVKFDRSITEGGIGRFIPESEDTGIAVIMNVHHVTPEGLTVHFRQYDKRLKTELLYGEEYMLFRLEGSEWVEVPKIIDNGAFEDIGYPIPEEGESEQEINWEGLYGKLPSGTYRIQKNVMNQQDTDKQGNLVTYPLEAEFIIAE